VPLLLIGTWEGRVCERGTATEIFYNPCHEYTRGLLHSIPNIENDDKQPLKPIAGTPVDLLNLPAGCPFAPRCERAMKACLLQQPEEYWVAQDHIASCWVNVQENRGMPLTALGGQDAARQTVAAQEEAVQ